MFKQLIDYLKSEEFNYSIIDDNTTAILGIQTEIANYHCIADVREEQNQLVFYAIFGFIMPANRRVAAAELLTKINYGLVIGNFEMEFDNGEIRYKTSIDFEGAELKDVLITNLIAANISTSDMFFPILMQFVSTTLSPDDVLKTMSAE